MQDPERDDEIEEQEEVADEIDPSPDLDPVTVFSSMNHDAEMEANTIHGMLDASGLNSLVIGPAVLPTLGFQVQVPRDQADEARRLIEESRQAGSQAAVEGELASEEGL